MTPQELKRWLKHPWKQKASLSRADAATHGIASGHDSFDQIIKMIEKDMSDWDDNDYRNAKRHNSFNARMLGNSPGRPVSAEVPMSKWEISLRNWGHDPRKPGSPGHYKIMDWIDEVFGGDHMKGEVLDKTAFYNIIKVAARGLRYDRQ